MALLFIWLMGSKHLSIKPWVMVFHENKVVFIWGVFTLLYLIRMNIILTECFIYARRFSKHFTNINTCISSHLCHVGTIIIPILQKSKWKHKSIKLTFSTANKQNWDMYSAMWESTFFYHYSTLLLIIIKNTGMKFMLLPISQTIFSFYYILL